MNLLVVLALAAYVAAPVPPAPPADPLKAAQEGFQGEWKIAASIRDGVRRPAAEVAGWKVVVKGGVLSIVAGDADNDEEMTFALDPKENPPAINLYLKVAERPTLTIKGIYKLEKDKLTICYAIGSAERPMEFKSDKGTETGLFALERAKK